MTQEVKIQKQESHEPERVEERPVYLPAADILAREDAFVALVDMPGVNPADIHVDIENNVLTLRGKTRHEVPDGYRRLYAEYEPGVFERSFTLSAETDRDGIQAQVQHGVLKLVLHKSKAAQPRKIQVQSGD